MRTKAASLVLLLLFLAAAINYLDRQVLAILSALPGFRGETGFGAIEYGYANAGFQAAYAVALPLVGRLIDRLGTRRGFLVVMGGWSLASLAHALARGPGGFMVARVALGAGEAGNFPAAIKTVAERFPARDRALATGIFNAGTSLGAVVAPLLIPFVYESFGWRACFLGTGLCAGAWIVAWSRLPPSSPSPPPQASLAPTVGSLLRDPQVRALAAAKFLTDPVWWFYLAWLPRFFVATQTTPSASVGTLGLPLAIVYVLSDLGSVGGGAACALLVRRGWPVLRARRVVMLAAALAVLPMALAPPHQLWPLVLLTGCATAAHQAWSANLFSLMSDRFPPSAVGRVVGIAGAAGSAGGILLAVVAGHVVAGDSFRPLFIAAATVYLLAWLILTGGPMSMAAHRRDRG
jgi:ACS family hexuronate transporter-like MFS transporter